MTPTGDSVAAQRAAARRGKALLIRMQPYDITQAIPRAAHTLEAMGYEVTILTHDKTNSLSVEEFQGNWRVIRQVEPYESGNKVSYLKAWLSWWRFVYQHLSENSYDVVQASNLESITPCVLSRMRREFPLIFDIRDLWGMSIPGGQDGPPLNRLVSRAFRAGERWAAKRSDAMVLNPAPLRAVAEYFGPKVAQKVPVAQVINVPLHDLGQDRTRPADTPFRINYSGHITYLRNAQAILDFAVANPDVQIDVVGKIDDQRLLQEFESLPNVVVYGFLPLAEAMEILGQAHLVALTYDVSTTVAVISTPNKLYEAMMMGRPYVASIGGYPSEVAAEAAIGWSVPYGDADALTELVGMLRRQPELVDEAGVRGRRLYESSFQWKDQQSNLESLYEFVRYGSPKPALQQDGWQQIVGSTITSRALQESSVAEI